MSKIECFDGLTSNIPLEPSQPLGGDGEHKIAELLDALTEWIMTIGTDLEMPETAKSRRTVERELNAAITAAVERGREEGKMEVYRDITLWANTQMGPIIVSQLDKEKQ